MAICSLYYWGEPERAPHSRDLHHFFMSYTRLLSVHPIAYNRISTWKTGILRARVPVNYRATCARPRSGRCHGILGTHCFGDPLVRMGTPGPHSTGRYWGPPSPIYRYIRDPGVPILPVDWGPPRENSNQLKISESQ